MYSTVAAVDSNNGNWKSSSSPTSRKQTKKQVMINATVQGKPAICLLDSGSGVTLVSNVFVMAIGALDRIRGSNISLKSFTGDPIPILGSIRAFQK